MLDDPERHEDNDALIARVAEQLRRPAPAAEWLDARIMREIRALQPREPRRWTRVVWPAAGLGLAAVVAIMVLRRPADNGRATVAPNAATAARTGVAEIASATGGTEMPGQTAAAHDSSVQTVRFAIAAPGARRVSVAGNFNGWDVRATPLRRAGNQWIAEVPLRAGRYVYMFVVDGNQWVPDPAAPHDAPDDFGTANSVVTVATSGGSV